MAAGGGVCRALDPVRPVAAVPRYRLPLEPIGQRVGRSRGVWRRDAAAAGLGRRAGPDVGHAAAGRRHHAAAGGAGRGRSGFASLVRAGAAPAARGRARGAGPVSGVGPGQRDAGGQVGSGGGPGGVCPASGIDPRGDGGRARRCDRGVAGDQQHAVCAVQQSQRPRRDLGRGSARPGSDRGDARVQQGGAVGRPRQFAAEYAVGDGRGRVDGARLCQVASGPVRRVPAELGSACHPDRTGPVRVRYGAGYAASAGCTGDGPHHLLRGDLSRPDHRPERPAVLDRQHHKRRMVRQLYRTAPASCGGSDAGGRGRPAGVARGEYWHQRRL